jgi:hypothetical protein
MNTENKIAEQAAEIANLHLVLADRQAKIAELMGEAARAGIAGAAASVLQPAAPQVDLSDDGIVKVLASFGIDADKSKYGFPELQVSTNIPGIRKIVAAYLAAAPDVAPHAPQALAEATQLFGETTESFYRRVVYGNGWNACRDAMLAAAPATPAAPLPEQTGPSVGDDPEFIGRVIAAASAVMGGDTSGEWQRFAAYIDSRLAASPSPALAQPTDTEALEMLARVLKYIDPHAVDVALARTGPMEDAYINTIARKCVERCMAKVEPAAPGASIGDAPSIDKPADGL